MRQTVVGVFDGFEAARHAAELLRQRGIDDDDIHVTAADDDAAPGDRHASRDPHDKGLLQRIKAFFSGTADDEDVGLYAEHVRRGGAVVAVDVDDDPHVDAARRVLEQAGAVDIDARAAPRRSGGGSAGRDDDRYPDALSGGGDIADHRTGLGTRAGIGGGADVPIGTRPVTGDTEGTAGAGAFGLAADPDDLVARGRDATELTVEHRGGVGHPLPPGSTGRRDGEPLEHRPLTVPDTEVGRGLSSTVTPDARGQRGSAASVDTARRSALLSGQDPDARRPPAAGGEAGIPVDRKHLPSGTSPAAAGGVGVDTRGVEDGGPGPADWREAHADAERPSPVGRDDFDAASFRSDFDCRYAATGGRWEDYEPAYRYGHRLRTDTDALDRGRDWDAVEADARTDWERQHPDATGASAWERLKGAVRHAWERGKG